MLANCSMATVGQIMESIALEQALLSITNPIDGSRPHFISETIKWHARLMSLAWSLFFPVAILAARFYKVLPKQDFPEQIDNQWWWITHRILVAAGSCAVVVAILIVYIFSGGEVAASSLHRYAGWAALVLFAVQIASGLLRGTTGGPKRPSYSGDLRGDHYDMTTRRIVFERVHKSIGYVALACAWVATTAGLWTVNAPLWIWLIVFIWWLSMGLFGLWLQMNNRAIDTYQAIWGIDSTLKGNRMISIGIGVHKFKPDKER